MAWAVWLAVPVVATLLVAAGAWWRARPARAPRTHEAMRAHQDFLAALVEPAQGAERTDQH